MAKTTIDGLRVREPSPKHPPVNSARSSSAHVVDMTRRRSAPSRPQTQSAAKRQAMLDSIDSIKHQSSATNFLDPVETFDFDAEPDSLDGDFTTDAEADWSDLLNSFDTAPSKKSQHAQKSLPSKAGRQNHSSLANWDDEETQNSNALSDLSPNSDFEADNDNSEDEDEVEPKIPRRYQKKLRPRKKHHIARIITISLLCLLLIGGGIFYKWGDELISRLTGGNSGLWDAIHSLVSAEVPFDADENGRTNVLIFGTEGYNMNGDTAYGEHDGAQLTDSIMVASFDQNTKDVALLSLPRDLKVRKACSAGKINEVFWCHNQDGTDEAAGANALMDQVGEVLGIKFQYYAHINWASLIDIINTIGGITVTLDEDINDYGWTNAVAQAGVPMEVNGEQALGLARARHGTTGGDFTRGNTQQKIVEGIVNKILQNGVGPQEALGLLGILDDNLRTNFSTDNIKAGAHLLAGFNITNIRQVPLVDYGSNTFYMTTATINNISYVVPAAGERDYSEIQKYVAEMFNSDPVVREKARIVVYNASGQVGVASAERERLQQDNYDVVGVGDAELGSCSERYCIFAVGQDFPATSAALAERYGVAVQGAEALPSGIEPGDTDFIIIIGFSGGEM